MKVCFDVSSALTQGAGVSRYIREVLAALLEMEDAPAITLFNNRRPNQNTDLLTLSTPKLPRIEVPLSDKLWRLSLLARVRMPQLAAFKNRFDLFHGTDVIAPAIPAPVVVTVHDMTTWLFPEFHTRANRWYQRLMLPLFMRRASHIIADSHSTKNDLIRLIGTPAEKVTVVHLGVDHTHFCARSVEEARQHVAAQINITSPYFLAVGTIEPRKNLRTLLDAFARTDLINKGYKVVLTGMKGWKVNALLQSLQLDSAISNAILFTGYVPDDLLPDLYAASAGFVYPSTYEGFGLPVLEAMACGAPVITSNTSSLPEVAGDAAILVSPTDTEAIAHAMRTLTLDKHETDIRRRLSIEQAAKFNWQTTAQNTMAIYLHALSKS
jgi:glycosyltransferase involved in cell wall biosynthesis